MTDIELTEIVIHEDGPHAGWTACLVADGKSVGFISHDRLPGFIDDRNLSELNLRIAGEEPHLGHHALAFRCTDLIAWEWMRRGVEDLLSREAVGIINEGRRAEILTVSVPEGGTLAGAISRLQTDAPTCTVLNHLRQDNAVRAYAIAAALIAGPS